MLILSNPVETSNSASTDSRRCLRRRLEPRNAASFIHLVGQKFVVDRWLYSDLVSDDVEWKSKKVIRRIPSCLDVAFTTFGNDHCTPLLMDRLQTPNGRRFRDGLDSSTTWRQFETWSIPFPRACGKRISTQVPRYPASCSAHALRRVPRLHANEGVGHENAEHSTRLVSQYRHDTILYAKQSYSGVPFLCRYPARIHGNPCLAFGRI